jgi:very-short-patch-repair endonuclease
MVANRPGHTASDVPGSDTRPSATRCGGHLDAVLRTGLVDFSALPGLVTQRSDRGIVVARRWLTRERSLDRSPECEHLVLAGFEPEPQFVIRDWQGVIARVDLGFPRARLAVEYDGEWHGQWRQISTDRERLNRLQAAGWNVLFVTARQLRDPHTMVAAVRTALAARPPVDPAPIWGHIGVIGSS